MKSCFSGGVAARLSFIRRRRRRERAVYPRVRRRRDLRHTGGRSQGGVGGFETGPAVLHRLRPAGADARVAAPASPGALSTLSDLRLAVVETDDKVQLPEILGNRARVGFDPVLRRGRTVAADPARTLWLRVRADCPAGGGKLYLSLPRQAIDRVRLYSGDAPESAARGNRPGQAGRTASAGPMPSCCRCPRATPPAPAPPTWRSRAAGC